MFEGLPTNPDPGRYWDMVQRHRITSFYTARARGDTGEIQGRYRGDIGLLHGIHRHL